jgi:hypothetical protein
MWTWIVHLTQKQKKMVFISILPFASIGYIRLRKEVLPVCKSAGVTSVMSSFLRSSSNRGLGHKASKDE